MFIILFYNVQKCECVCVCARASACLLFEV